MNAIKCCNGCVAPKRHPACHDHCEEYKKERAEYDERKAIADKKKFTEQGIYLQRAEAVAKATKHKKQHGFHRKGKTNNG